MVSPLSRRLPDGDNDNGRGWECSKYAYYLATGIRMNYKPHPSYGPCNGRDMVNYLIKNCGYKSCGKKAGAIFAYNTSGYGHCFPLDHTEVLTPNGFKRLEDMRVGDAIFQVKPETWEVEETTVKGVTTPILDKVYRRKDIEATDGHWFWVSSNRKSWSKKQWKDIKDSTSYWTPLVQEKHGGISLSDDEIRLLIAIQADASYENTALVRFHLKKQRKIERLKTLLNSLGIEFSENLQSSGNTKINFTKPAFLDEYLPNKRFGEKLLRMSYQQIEVFKEELPFWDGSLYSYGGAKFASYIRENIDIAQAILTLGGYKTSSTLEKELHIFKGKPNEQPVRNAKSLENERETWVGCVNVDNNCIIVRQFGHCFIAQNTGMVLNPNTNQVNDANWNPKRVATHTINLDAVRASYCCQPNSPTPSGFLPTKGYWGLGDQDARIGTLSSFMRKTFPAYTPAAALGNYYGKNLANSIKTFQRKTGLTADSNTGPITYKMLQKYGFKG